jgi:hypothetical protein
LSAGFSAPASKIREYCVAHGACRASAGRLVAGVTSDSSGQFMHTHARVRLFFTLLSGFFDDVSGIHPIFRASVSP